MPVGVRVGVKKVAFVENVRIPWTRRFSCLLNQRIPFQAHYTIRQLCKQKGLTPNGLATTSAVPQATIKSILNGESKNPGAVTIKKLCDGFEITLGEFFSTPEFDALEQEIK